MSINPEYFLYSTGHNIYSRMINIKCFYLSFEIQKFGFEEKKAELDFKLLKIQNSLLISFSKLNSLQKYQADMLANKTFVISYNFPISVNLIFVVHKLPEF